MSDKKLMVFSGIDGCYMLIDDNEENALKRVLDLSLIHI